jgi:two-component system, chemotaxis family, chemotaxis protein CheY
MYAAPTPAPNASKQALTGDSPFPAPTEFHFLVVDDMASMRRVMSSLLRQELGHVRLSEAPDGASALQAIKAARDDIMPINFIVTDWNMPGMDGITLLRSIRENPQLRDLPVLMVTAEATREVVLEAARAGADGYIVKPFNTTTLRTKLQQILAKRGGLH